MMFGLKRISIGFGLVAMLGTSALAQGFAPNANQATADAVANSLRASRALSAHRIEVRAREGVVTLSGVLSTAALKSEALVRAQQTSGVSGVIDDLQVTSDRSVLPVQYEPQLAMGHHHGLGGGGAAGGYDYGMDAGAAGGAMGLNEAPVTDASAFGGPVPEGPAGMTGATQASMPGQPNYAWPSYAPYPNFSAVGYPTVYPWQAWPNIGPFYPYPEVPLDWRAVTLRWDDGIWWLDFKKNYTRPFFVPYPFGLLAY